jgi:MFS family permease
MHPTRVYYVLSVLIGLCMFLPATSYVPFLLELGLTLADVALLNAGFFSMVVIAEIPTGMLADGKSRAWSIRAGMTMLGIGSIAYAFATGFWSALLAELLLGIAWAFLSGAQQAWLADALARREETDRLAQSFGTATFLGMMAAVVAGASGGLLSIADLRWPYVASATCSIIGLGFGYRYLGNLGEPEDRVSEFQALRKSVSALRASRALGWVVAACIVYGLVLPFNYYWAPFYRNLIGEVRASLLWIPMYLTLALSGLFIRRRGVREGKEAHWLIAALLLAGLGLAGMGQVESVLASVGCVLLHEFGRGLFAPVVDTYTHRRIESHYRATYGSLQSFLGRFGFAVVLLVLWWKTRDFPTTPAAMMSIWTAAGLLLLALTCLLWLCRPKE